jgi:hypothetical protein
MESNEAMKWKNMGNDKCEGVLKPKRERRIKEEGNNDRDKNIIIIIIIIINVTVIIIYRNWACTRWQLSYPSTDKDNEATLYHMKYERNRSELFYGECK